MPKAPLRDIVMYHEEAGAGEPLVLIMGLGGDLQGWALNVPELAAHHRVITLDNRGAGRTSAPDRPYSIAAMADDVAALLDHLGVAKTHVLGFSMGGMIAQELTLRHAAKVDKLVLVATTSALDAYSRNVVRTFCDIRRSNMSKEQAQRATANFIYSAEFMADSERYERGLQAGLANPHAQQDHAFLRQADACLAFDSSDRLAGVKHETLLVASAEDILVPPRNSEAIAGALPNATLLQLPGAHGGVIERAPAYNAAFLEFLRA
jgi:3-oxoadipate enol-lactonase